MNDNNNRTWTAQIVCEGEVHQESTGDTAKGAVLNMLSDILDGWKGDGGLPVGCGDFLSEIADAVIEIELHHDDEEDSVFVVQCGDMTQFWKLVVSREDGDEDGGEDDMCDQLDAGCQCESCAEQIASALGMVINE